MLLGDGCIQKNNNSLKNKKHKDSYWFAFRHSMNQVEYAEWKKSLIDNFFLKKGVTRKFSWKTDLPNFLKKTNKTYYACEYRLYWSTWFRIFHAWVYRQDRTKNAMFLLRHMETDKQLAIWFMDDGSQEWNINTHIDGTKYITNPRLMLHICNFTMGDAQIIVDWFKKKYNVEPRIVKTSKEQKELPRLRFTVKDSRQLFQHIKVYVKQFECTRKKFALCLERY